MALVGADAVREYIPSLTGTSEDAQIEGLIGKFNGLAAGYCGFPSASVGGSPSLEVVTYTDHLDGDGTKYLQLPIMPVTAITSIHVDVDRVYGSDKLVDSGDYELFGDEGLVTLKQTSTQGAWDKGRRGVKVIYTAGYSTTPFAIRHACCLQVAHWWSARSHIGKSSVSQGGGSASVATLELLPETKQALQPYRLASAFMG